MDWVDEVVSSVRRQSLVAMIIKRIGDQETPRPGKPSLPGRPSLFDFVLTSRPLPELGQLPHPQFDHYRVKPFGREQVQTFAENWFSARSGSSYDAREFVQLAATPAAPVSVSNGRQLRRSTRLRPAPPECAAPRGSRTNVVGVEAVRRILCEFDRPAGEGARTVTGSFFETPRAGHPVRQRSKWIIQSRRWRIGPGDLAPHVRI